MIPAQQPERRTRYFINRGFQLRYMGVFIGAAFLTSFIIGGILFYLIRMNWEVYLAMRLEMFEEIKVLLAYQQNWLILVLVVSFAIMSVLLSWWSLILSHRIAGPVFALSRRMTQIVLNRDLINPLFFRKKDELQEVKNFFNQTLEVLQNQLREDLHYWQNLYDQLSLKGASFKHIVHQVERLKKSKEQWLGIESLNI